MTDPLKPQGVDPPADRGPQPPAESGGSAEVRWERIERLLEAVHAELSSLTRFTEQRQFSATATVGALVQLLALGLLVLAGIDVVFGRPASQLLVTLGFGILLQLLALTCFLLAGGRWR